MKRLCVSKVEVSSPRPSGPICHPLNQQKVAQGHYHCKEMLKMKIDPAMCMKTKNDGQNITINYAQKCKIEADFAENCRF
jgi:hypothetical protein